jgi:hypothetical protein
MTSPPRGLTGSGGCWSAGATAPESAYYRCFSPALVPLTTLVRVAGRRWAVEEDFQAGKELTGLGQHQVRTWTSWHRWATLALLAHAFLTVTAAVEHARAPAPDDQIPLTRNEIGHLITVVLLPPIWALRRRLHCSTWRRRHQHRTRTSHYQRQARNREDHELQLEYLPRTAVASAGHRKIGRPL